MGIRRRFLAVAVVVATLAACSSGGGGGVDASGRADRVTTTATTTTTVPTTVETSAHPTKVLVVGDSLALLLSFALDRKGTPQGLEVHGAGVLGCGILPGVSLRYGQPVDTATRCAFVPQMWQDQLAAVDPDVVVVLDGFWDAYDWVIDGQTVAFGTPEWDAWAKVQLGAAMDALSAGGRRVVWLLSPYFRPDTIEPAIQRYADRHGEYRSALDDERVRHFNDLVREVASEKTCSVNVVDSRLCICPEDRYADTIDGFDVRGDGVHLTDAGADRLAEYVIPRALLAASVDC